MPCLSFKASCLGVLLFMLDISYLSQFYHQAQVSLLAQLYFSNRETLVKLSDQNKFFQPIPGGLPPVLIWREGQYFFLMFITQACLLYAFLRQGFAAPQRSVDFFIALAEQGRDLFVILLVLEGQQPPAETQHHFRWLVLYLLQTLKHNA